MKTIKIVDVETTSMKGDICEIGITFMKEVSDIENTTNKTVIITDTISQLVEPPVPIQYGAMAVHHITNDDVKGQPKLEEVLAQEDYTLTNVDYVVAHNLPYEKGCLPKECFNKSTKQLCTLKLARALVPKDECDSHTLGALWYFLGCDKDPQKDNYTGEFHSAAFDTFATGMVLQKLLSRYDLTIDQAYDLVGDYTKFKFGKYKGVKYETVIQKDYGYVEYCVSEYEFDDDEELEILQELLSQYESVKLEQVKICTKAKYLNKPWVEVVDQDIEYVNFLINKGYLKGAELEYVESLM